MEHNIKYVEHLKLRNMLESLLNFIEGNNSNLDQSDYDTSYKVWSGFDIVVRLKGIGLGPDSFQEYQRCFEQAVAQSEDEAMSVRDRQNQEVKMSSNTSKILEQLFQILDYMYRDDLKFVEDYRVAIMKSMQYVSNRDTGDRWLGKNRRGGSRIVVFTLNFWCMNPAVAFSDFSSCRNVVLSSGTLSPMSSFASELGTPFPIQLEANHIIEDKQVWVGAVGVGPAGKQLQAVYRNMETFDFQDELGDFIYQVCTKVPHGVLCFLPSYRALEKFTDRWRLTGLWSKLASRKRVMVEPRAADREDFDGMMKAFYEVVKGDLYNDYLDEDECNDDDSEIDGALFFAVCRGKVSEGMDFADNNARAVITVGIPFPSIKDVQVKLKREYNDKHRIDRGLLSGSDWYEIQAFRALNQALGRCIRHRKDWGALIIVDDRFVKRTDKYCKSLSRWVRSKVQTFHAFSDFLGSMSDFTEKMVKEMPIVDPDTSFIPCTPGDGRRDSSIYKRHSLDESHLNNSIPASPNFSSPPMSQSPHMQNLFRTPEIPDKGRTATSPAVTGLAGVSSPSIQQQIMNVINSGTAPKDQPYYIILNQGTPSEQAFLIEPNKHGGSNPTQTKVPFTMSQMSDTSLPGSSQQHKIVFNIPPQLPVQGTSLLQNQILLSPSQAALQGTSLNPDIKGGNQQSSLNFPVGEKKENVPKEEKKTDMVFTLGSSSLSAEEQLKRFVSSSQAPRNQAYYVVVNNGEANERAFFIEPNKKAKPKPGSERKTETEKTDSSVATNEAARSEQEVKPVKSEQDLKPVKSEQEVKPVKSEQDLKPVKSEQEEVVPDSSTEGDPEPQNKFLKFCQLPKTPSKVPVATVTPQRQAEQTVTSVKTEPDSHHKSVPSTSDPHPPACTSPVLFEDVPVDVSAGAGVDNTSNVADTENELNTKKKPIFKKRNSLSTKMPKEDFIVQSENVEKNEVENLRRDNNVEKDSNEVDGADSDFKTESNARTKLTTRGKVNRSVVDKVKQGRKKSTDGMILQDTARENTLAEVDGIAASGNDVHSDEEFLNTRRRGGRKRKSTSKFEEWSKRSKKGVIYDDVDNTAEKENEVGSKYLSCVKCGKQLLKSSYHEKQKRHPEFLSGVFKKNVELLHFPNVKAEEVLLQTVVAEASSKGLLLNSVYDDTARCCIQYLECKACKTDTVIGARVLLADSNSRYKFGQTWILSSAAKI
ncbi:Fanconi anemia group J protein homolog [Mercenaria mercenaria]|uniref:Fanconi anemia group J protein homolog n=1 Tax=Mercenaria mercenaria TaxID=6596 RepID=UPI00234FA5C6|nr:Fanconi anemia group J protein homolog [Mercenaria mercenaria]